MSVTGKIAIPRRSLNLKLMLEGGQCFRWKKLDENKWKGVVSKILWSLTQYDDYLEYTASSLEKIDSSYCRSFLNKYFRLDVDLEALYSKWSNDDQHFAKVAAGSPGLRILSQDPIENLFSFICSSNNNIVRISSMVENMCKLYGENIADEDGVSYYGFPHIDRLAGPGVEESLRTAGFGYRAKYIHKSAVRLVELGGEDWLAGLSRGSYEDAKSSLIQLEGVGPKVADCICLMSLGHLCAVPVDTHVFQIAAQHYLPQLKSVKSCTPKIYSQICDHFVHLYGPYAGWAHCVLFCADLRMFKEENAKLDKHQKKTKSVKPTLSGAKNSKNERAVCGEKVDEEKLAEPNVNGVRKAGRKLREANECDENLEAKRVKLRKQGRHRSCKK